MPVSEWRRSIEHDCEALDLRTLTDPFQVVIRDDNDGCSNSRCDCRAQQLTHHCDESACGGSKPRPHKRTANHGNEEQQHQSKYLPAMAVGQLQAASQARTRPEPATQP